MFTPDRANSQIKSKTKEDNKANKASFMVYLSK